MGCAWFAGERSFIFLSVLLVWMRLTLSSAFGGKFSSAYFLKLRIRLLRLLCLDLDPFLVGKNLINQLRNPINYAKPCIKYPFYVLFR